MEELVVTVVSMRLALMESRAGVSPATRTTRRTSLPPVLPKYHTPDADIHAIYPQRHQLAARVRAFVDFVAMALQPSKPLK